MHVRREIIALKGISMGPLEPSPDSSAVKHVNPSLLDQSKLYDPTSSLSSNLI